MLTSSVYGRKVSAINKQALNGVAFKSKNKRKRSSRKGSYITVDDLNSRQHYLKNKAKRAMRAEEQRRAMWRKEQKRLVAQTVKEIFGKSLDDLNRGTSGSHC